MNELPELPRILKKIEASTTPQVEQWFLSNYPESVLIEVKATKKNTISPSAVKPHQILALKAARSAKGIVHKMSDIGMVRQPADFFMLKNTQSFIVACFLKDKICLAIDPSKWNGANITTKCEFSFKI